MSLFLTAAAAGQVPSPTGNIFAQVLDEQGRSVSGVTATLTGPGATQWATTDAKGDFHFLNLSPGAYSVTLAHERFETVRRDVTVLLGKNAVFSATLLLAGAAEAVAVSGQAPVVDNRKTETGATYDQKELQSIPTTRDPAAILRQVPGVLLFNVNVGGSDNLFQPGFVGKGSHSDQNTFNLEGVGLTEAYGGTVYFDFDSLDSIEVATGGSDPSIATPGVTLNLTTKRGTNQILGSARALYAQTAGWDYGVEAGGPLWKDRLWIWAAFAHNASLPQTILTADVPPEAVVQQPTIQHWNAKLNAQPDPANLLTLAYLDSDKSNPANGASRYTSQAATWTQHFPAAAYRIEDSQVLSPKLFASLYFSYLSLSVRNIPNGGLDAQAYQDFHQVWQYSYSSYDSKRPQYQAGLTASGFFDTGDLRHELKFGFGYKQIQGDSLSTWPGNQLVGYDSFTPPLATITRPASNKLVQNYYDTYAGDTIQVGKLTASVGVRFDYQQGKNLPSAVPANPVFPELLPAVQYGGDEGYPVTWRQFEPRVGATYAFGSARKTLLRASYSRFSNRLGTETTFVSAFPGTASLVYVWNDVNGNHNVEPDEIDFSTPPFGIGVDPTNPTSTASVNQIAQPLRPPTTDEFIVGAEREILPDLSAALAYTHRSVHDLEFASNQYIPLIGTSRGSYHYIGNAAGSVTSTDGFVLDFSEPYYGLNLDGCPAPCSGFVLENRPDFTETYSGVELQVVKRLSHGWMLRASFAYNDWQQHVGSGSIIDPNNFAGGINRNGSVGESIGGNYINSTWQFNVSGAVELPFGVLAGANFFGRQGFPILYFVQAITNDVPANSFDSPLIQIGSVGAYRLPSVFLLDLQVERPFRIGSTVTISPILDCFNVANSHTVLQRDGSVGIYNADGTPVFQPNDGFNRPLQFLNSRVFRGGVRITF